MDEKKKKIMDQLYKNGKMIDDEIDWTSIKDDKGDSENE